MTRKGSFFEEGQIGGDEREGERNVAKRSGEEEMERGIRTQDQESERDKAESPCQEGVKVKFLCNGPEVSTSRLHFIRIKLQNCEYYDGV